MHSLGEEIEYGGPQSFSAERIRCVENLFKQRHALFYTPTSNIPLEFVGSGVLDVVLPIATPTYLEVIAGRSYHTPRLWVDLLQRATGKLRWESTFPADVLITRYDIDGDLGAFAIGGTKAVVDALKVRTSGRSDGRYLYYLGAILDDSHRHIDFRFEEVEVADPSQGKTRLVVRPRSSLA